MSKGHGKFSAISVCTYIGIFAILLTIVSDLLLIGSPISAYEYIIVGTETMAKLPLWRISVGTFLGVMVIPFQVCGFIPLYYAVKPAGRIKTLAVVLPIVYGMFMAAVFHASYVFIGASWKLYHSNEQQDKGLLYLLNEFQNYWIFILLIISVSVIISSVFYSILVFKGKTLLPRWLALFNPIAVFLFMFLIIIVIPAPLGGFIAPTYLNMSTLVFIMLIYLNIKI
jgi:hypothetical protein